METSPPHQSIEACPLCHALGGQPFFRSNGRRLKRGYLVCAACALVWVPKADQISPAAEKARYDLHQNNADDSGYQQHLARLVEPLVTALPSAAAGLDFGCGPSPVLQGLLVDAGYPTRTYDPFYAPDDSALHSQYDFITATEVIEHLSAPGVELDRLWDMVNPDGLLALMTQLRSPKHAFASWHYKNDATHISFFAKASMTYLSERWGSQCLFVAEDVFFFRKPAA